MAATKTVVPPNSHHITYSSHATWVRTTRLPRALKLRGPFIGTPGHPETLDLPTRVTVDCTSSRRCQVHFLVVPKLTVVTSFLLRNYRFFFRSPPPPPKIFSLLSSTFFYVRWEGVGPHLLHIYSLGTFLCPFLLAVSL